MKWLIDVLAKRALAVLLVAATGALLAVAQHLGVELPADVLVVQ